MLNALMVRCIEGNNTGACGVWSLEFSTSTRKDGLKTARVLQSDLTILSLALSLVQSFQLMSARDACRCFQRPATSRMAAPRCLLRQAWPRQRWKVPEQTKM